MIREALSKIPKDKSTPVVQAFKLALYRKEGNH